MRMVVKFTVSNPKKYTTSEGLFQYLDKENEGRIENSISEYEEDIKKRSQFFSSRNNKKEQFFDREYVTKSIDENLGGKMSKNQSRFFMLNVSPSKKELEHINKMVEKEIKKNGIGKDEIQFLEKHETGKEHLYQLKTDIKHQFLRDYARDVMKLYAFNFDRKVYANPEKLPNQGEEKIIREFTKLEMEKLKIDPKSPKYGKKYQEIREMKAREMGKDLSMRSLEEKDLVWYAKVEETRTYSLYDKWVRENENIQMKIEVANEQKKSGKKTEEEIDKTVKKLMEKLHRDKNTGKIIQRGMKKPGEQDHIHIVVSRYDNCPNKRYKTSLSPMSNQKGGKIAGKQIDVGFNRDQFFRSVEYRFDQEFDFKRTFGYEQYKKSKQMHSARKILNTSSKNIQNAAIRTIGKEIGVKIPVKIPATPMQACIEVLKIVAEKIIEI